MRRIIFAVFILLPAIAISQINPKPNLHKNFGVKAGIGLSIPSGRGENDLIRNNYSYSIGFFAEFLNLNKFNFIVEVGYKNIGHTIKTASWETNDGKVNLRYHYIPFGLYGKYRFSNSTQTPYLISGLRVDYFVKSYLTGYEDDGVSPNNSYFLPDFYNRSVPGLTIGAGYEFKKYFAELQFNPNFIKSSDNNSIRYVTYDIKFGMKF